MSDELPKGWATARISDVTERVPNSKPEDSPEKEFGYVDISSIDNSSFVITDVKRFKGKDAPSRARRPIRPNDIVFSNVRTYLRNVALVDRDCPAEVCSTGFTVLRPNAAVEPRFLFRYVLTDQFLDRVTPQQTGTHYPATSDRVVMSETIPLAPLPEQRRIVAKLETLLAKVDASQLRLAKLPVLLKRFRQSVLAAACSGRLTADWREERTTDCTDDTDKTSSVKSAKSVVKKTVPSLLHEIKERRKQLWTAQRKANGLTSTSVDYPEPANPSDGFEFDVPESWEMCSMDALTSVITSGSRDWKQYYRPDGSGTFIMAQNIRPLRFDRSYRLAVAPPENNRDRTRSEVFKNDLLVTIVGANTADCCRVPEKLGEHYVCQSVALMRPVLPQTSCFLELFLNSPGHGLAEWRKWIYGEGRPHLSFDNLRETLICLPPLPEQQEIVRRVEGLFALADQLELRLAKARRQVAALTPSLLARAFAGRLVPQDPTDEPAEKLLERIKSNHEAKARRAARDSPAVHRRNMTRPRVRASSLSKAAK